jgi:hypothetical protein
MSSAIAGATGLASSSQTRNTNLTSVPMEIFTVVLPTTALIVTSCCLGSSAILAGGVTAGPTCGQNSARTPSDGLYLRLHTHKQSCKVGYSPILIVNSTLMGAIVSCCHSAVSTLHLDRVRTATASAYLKTFTQKSTNDTF